MDSRPWQLRKNTFNHEKNNKLALSDIPEEIILAVLGNYQGESPEKVIRTILERIIKITPNQLLLQKYIRQLGILSKLRNLQVETFKLIEDMGIRYNIETDVIYQKGMEKGVEKGVEKGKKEMIVELLKDASLSVEKIARIAKVSVAYIRQIQKEME